MRYEESLTCSAWIFWRKQCPNQRTYSLDKNAPTKKGMLHGSKTPRNTKPRKKITKRTRTMSVYAIHILSGFSRSCQKSVVNHPLAFSPFIIRLTWKTAIIKTQAKISFCSEYRIPRTRSVVIRAWSLLQSLLRFTKFSYPSE